MSVLNKFRERVNLAIYDSKERVFQTFRIINVFVTLGTFGTLLYYYGFPQDTETSFWSILTFKLSFTFYIIYYFIRFFFDFSPGQFLREHWFEGIIMLILAIEGIVSMLFGVTLIENLFVSWGFYNFEEVSLIFVPIYFLVVMIVEVTKASRIQPIITMNPAMLFMFSFILIILCGTFLLMMPEMTTINGSMPFIDALFTSTSATCVTGLSVVDVSTYFTFKGQVVIVLLIQLGGLNIVAFVAFIIMMSKLGIGLKYNTLLDDYAKKGTIESALGMFWKILRWCLVIEFIGATLFYIFLDPATPIIVGNGDRVFSSVFHAVSAFNNAGFSIHYDNLHNEYLRFNFPIHIIIMTLIFFGSLGFATMFDIFSVSSMRSRMRQPWRSINFNSKVALYFSLILVAAGALVFYFLEQDNTIKDMDEGGRWVTALFQSITTRTAGFNTVNIGDLATPVIVFMLFLMFIGASSGSTGGGIKTSTFAILWAATVATFRDRKNVELFKRTIKSETVLKAFTVLLFFIAWNFIAIFLLLITETEILADPRWDSMHLIFEQVSAFATAGLSMGITADLTFAGKVIIISSMYIGKIGALTLAYLFGKPITTNYKYPDADSTVG